MYVGQVGLWMPWDPESYKTGKVEYMEKELNNLMNEYNSQEDKTKRAFNTRVKESKKKAIAENIIKAKKYGNKLTQNINEDGELVNALNTTENILNQNTVVSSADIRKELFEGDNIRTKDMPSAEKEYHSRKKN